MNPQPPHPPQHISPELRRALDALSPGWDIPKPRPVLPSFAPTKYDPQRADVIDRATAYLATLPPSVSGQNGHSALLWAARCMAWGFALSEADSIAILFEHFVPRCVPPTWTESDIKHKVADVLLGEGFGKPRGWLLGEDSAAWVNRNMFASGGTGANSGSNPGPAAGSGYNLSPELLDMLSGKKNTANVPEDSAGGEAVLPATPPTPPAIVAASPAPTFPVPSPVGQREGLSPVSPVAPAPIAPTVAEPIPFGLPSTPSGPGEPNAPLEPNGNPGDTNPNRRFDSLIVPRHDSIFDPQPLRGTSPTDDYTHLARRFLVRFAHRSGIYGFRIWNDKAYRWNGHCYEDYAEGILKADVWHFLEAEYQRLHVPIYRAYLQSLERGDTTAREPLKKSVTNTIRNNVREAIPGPDTTAQLGMESPPVWITGREVSLTLNGELPVSDLVSMQNGILDLRSRRLYQHTPALFSLSFLPYEYDPRATCLRWLQFVDDTFENDAETVACLQEFVGYVLTPVTKYQKSLLIQGPPGTGKGTFFRVVSKLVGEQNTCFPDVNTLATDPFAREQFIGKLLLVFADLRITNRDDAASMLRLLLDLVGEDPVSIRRKWIDTITLRLFARVMIGMNELPKLPDSSSATLRRYLILRSRPKAPENPNPNLERELLCELPGIFNWAVEGWHRLNERGRFIQPGRSHEMLAEMRDLNSPITQFVEDCCELGEDEQCTKQELYEEWEKWCKQNGHKPGNSGDFSTRLKGAFPQIKEGGKAPRSEGRRRLWKGIDVDYTANGIPI